MPHKFHLSVIRILLICFSAQTIFAVPLKQLPKGETKLAVLKMTFENFGDEDQESFRVAFYKELHKLEGVEVLPEPSSSQAIDHLQTLKQLQADFGLVANMIKVGTFVKVNIQILNATTDSTEVIEAGTGTIDWPGIPAIVAQIKERIPLKQQAEQQETEQDGDEGLPWWKIALSGVAVGGIVTAIIIIIDHPDPELPAPDSLP